MRPAPIVLRKALDLPQEVRAEIAVELIASLEPEPVDDPAEIERAWAVEIERRARQALAGESNALPWPEVRRRVEQRLAGR